MLHALIMAGGGGTRFWPRSRLARPKQFLALAGDHTLLQQAHERIEALAPPDQRWVITGEAYREETARQLPELPAAQVIGEPTGRDTAPCIGLGAALIARRDREGVMAVMPADHLIEPVQLFRQTLQAAVRLVEEHPQALLTFGIPPTFASTGYGYIHRGAPIPGRGGVRAFRVQGFREKPEQPVADQFFASGEYFWNSGIFVWKAATILRQLADRQPELHAGVQRIAEAWDTPARQGVLAEVFPRLTRISIDFAVMEHAPEVLVVEAPYRWDDVGSWLALERLHAQDADGNTVQADHCGVNTRGCVLVAEPGHTLATVGVEDLIIIQDGGVTLVAHRSAEGDVKKLVEKLRQQNRTDLL